ncbi:MAG: tetratricopeptide repeat protein [Cyanobacteria bacterium REEB67]|nr:tetratricopeptide repeat protein [Cyanobacteria bacterium REEB67]
MQPLLAAPFNYLLEARKAVLKNDYHRAVNMTDLAIRQNPRDADSYYFKAYCHAVLQQPQEALSSYERGLKLAPCSDPHITVEIAKTYIGLDKSDKAIALLDGALKVTPMSDAYRCKGQILFRRKETLPAIACYDQAIKLEPRNLWNYDDRVVCYMSLNRYSDALKDLNKMVEIAPTSARGYSLRARVYEKLGDKAAAKKDREKSNSLGEQEWF